MAAAPAIPYLAHMPVYRFYSLAAPDQQRPVEATFFSDQAAMNWAYRRAHAVGIEVWQGARFVARLHGVDRTDGPGPDGADPGP